MSKNVLRIRFLSLNDAVDKPFSNILLYLKKLTQTSTSCGSAIKLHEKDSKSSIVLTFNRTFDLLLDDEYLQILFIESRTKPKVIADLIFWRNHLIDLINNRRDNNDIQKELLCSARLERDYVLKFSLQLVEDFVKINKVHRKMANHQPIRGHSMLIKQFKQPVHCAICNRFIWGIHHQGYECLQCSLVTHRKCHQYIPFWCQKSPNLGPCLLTGNHRFEFHIPHVFKDYELPVVQCLVSGDHSYCSHCGSHVLRHARKCIVCHFIVHKQCEVNIPPMCTITYISVANALKKGVLVITPPIPCDSSLNTTETRERTNSDSSSCVLIWPNLSPREELIHLPKFSDFQCIGRLGSGRYANVYCAQHIPSTEYVAIKVIDGSIEQARQQFEVERHILFRYSNENPYMVKGYCTFHQGSNLFFVMEFVDGDTLNHKIQKTRMNEDEIRFYLAELISVLQYLHSNNIVYRDLKLEHVIVCSEGHIRLVDYGLGRLLKTSDEICHTVCGTDGYMAPEVRRLENGSSEGGYSYPVDYWALGIMFVQMLCGEQFDFHPQMFSENKDEINYPSNFAKNLQLSRKISSEAQSCLTGLLEIDPEKRLGSLNSPHGSIRDHLFFKVGRKIDWQEIDEGVFKSIYKRRTLIRTISDASVDLRLSTLFLDRGDRTKVNWVTAGESTCLPVEEERFKLFDYVHQPTWCKLSQSNSSSDLF